MAEKIATREAFGKAIAALSTEYPELIVLDADLAGATKSAEFKKVCPERFIDMGIAEADMVGVSAGLATCGKKPFCCSFAMFTTGRAYEQVRNSVAYPHLNVKVIGSHGGLSVGEDGATHQCLEDLGTMRTIPGMAIVNPADATEARAAVEWAINYVGPVYLRFGRLAVPVLFDKNDYKFEFGKNVVLRDGKDVTIMATGITVAMALEAAKLLENEGISARVVNVHTIKPIDADNVAACAAETGAIVTAEEHNIIGGLGSAVSEVVCERCPVPVLRVGVEDCFGRSGKVPALLEMYGLTPAHIAEKAKAAVKMK